MKLRKILSVFLLLWLLTLCGCAGGEDISQYYTLPRPTENYRALHERLEAETEAGFEFAAPLRGEIRSSICLRDLDGDGAPEAAVFLRDSGTKRPRILLCTAAERECAELLSLTGEGSDVEQSAFADLTGDGIPELIVSYGGAGERQLLRVYSLRGWSGTVLLSCECTEFVLCDMDGSGGSELCVLLTGEEAEVRVCCFTGEGESESFSAPLSAGIRELTRAEGCTLEGNAPALLAESFLYSGEMVSDLFTLLDRELYNITLDGKSGVSRTRRSYAVAAEDIDGDHFLEVPVSTALFSQSSAASYRSLIWTGFSRYGQSQSKLVTYHCFQDGWYFTIPELWSGSLTVRRDDSLPGEHSVILSEINRGTGEITDKLVITALTGENRTERAHAEGRILLGGNDSTLYVGRILTGLSEEEISERFFLIEDKSAFSFS